MLSRRSYLKLTARPVLRNLNLKSRRLQPNKLRQPPLDPLDHPIDSIDVHLSRLREIRNLDLRSLSTGDWSIAGEPRHEARGRAEGSIDVPLLEHCMVVDGWSTSSIDGLLLLGSSSCLEGSIVMRMSEDGLTAVRSTDTRT